MNEYKMMYEMNRKHISMEEICKALGISRSAFYRKRKGKTEFTNSEINKFCDYVGCSPIGIFFSEKVT